MSRALIAAAALASSACLDVPHVELGSDAGSAAPNNRIDAGSEDASTDEKPTGRIELAGTTWLAQSIVPVSFTGVSRVGDPFLAVFSPRSPSAVRSFTLPFAEGELATTGTHAFAPFPVGNYVVRLMYDGDKVLQELPFQVLADTDMDGTADEDDGCPLDPNKLSEGTCGCGTADTDTNGDDVPDCPISCPAGSLNSAPGLCGCDVAETDTDGDQTPDCTDRCANDMLKVEPGTCGCGTADTDADGDNTLDCDDLCPNDRLKDAPGDCGCGMAEGTCPPPPCSNELLPDTRLSVGEERCSANGRFSFGLGSDGYLTFREGSTVLWTAYQVATGTQLPFLPADALALQASDGNLLAYAGTASLWSAGVRMKPDTVLTVEDNGSVVIRQAGVPVWTLGPFQVGDLRCREARENQTGRLACPTGQTIAVLDFVSYGKPTGGCGTYVADTACQYLPAKSFVETRCLGMNSCEFVVDKSDFTVPCSGQKKIAVAYTCDACPDDPAKTSPGLCGCGKADTDTDLDLTVDCNDGCPADGAKTAPGLCGCGVPEGCQTDLCPQDPDKTAPGQCGCGTADTNADGDTIADCTDNCPSVTNENQADWNADDQGDVCDDSDGDSVLDSGDNCRSEPNNAQINSDNDALGDACDDNDDNDSALDVDESCDTDPAKSDPGLCGCGIADTDSDIDGIADCVDSCPADPTKSAPGVCGCGIAEDDCPPACSNELLPGTQLQVGQKRCSQNGRFKFILGSDGYLTLREGNDILWAAYQVAAGTQTPFVPAASVNMQASDGNLVAYTAANAPLWSAGVKMKPDSVLTVENDGSVVIRYQGAVAWSIGPFQNGETRCRDSRENQTMRMACPAGKTISGIQFASYGKPTGACGSYASEPTCHFDAQTIVQTNCLGKNNCDFAVVKPTFPSTVCSGQKKLLTQYTCM